MEGHASGPDEILYMSAGPAVWDNSAAPALSAVFTVASQSGFMLVLSIQGTGYCASASQLLRSTLTPQLPAVRARQAAFAALHGQT